MAYDFKSESEVKEFLYKLGIEYRFGCYSEKKPEVCHLLGDYLEAVKKDFEKASKVFKNNCDEYHFSKSCYKYGKFLLVGKGQGKENIQEAYKYFEKGCGFDDPDSCLHQGLMLVTNNTKLNIERDVKKGMAALEKSCLGNNANACYYLSGMYISGVQKERMDVLSKPSEKEEDYVVLKDMPKAFQFAVKGCDLGNMYSCANLSQMYLKGEGVQKDPELADKYKKIALDMQDQVMNQKPSLTFQEGLPPT